MPAITRRGPDDGCSRISANENFFTWTSAATPCGVSLGTVASNNLSGSNSVSTWEPICGSRRAARGCADSLKNTARNFSPLRTASSMMRKPSIAHSPEEVSSLRLNAWRNSLTRALWRPSIRRKRPPSAWVDWVNRALPPQEIIRAYRRYAWGCGIFTVSNPTILETDVRVEMVKINSEKPEPSLIRYAADQIRAGQVLGMPTDTFYGLAADPF